MTMKHIITGVIVGTFVSMIYIAVVATLDRQDSIERLNEAYETAQRHQDVLKRMHREYWIIRKEP